MVVKEITFSSMVFPKEVPYSQDKSERTVRIKAGNDRNSIVVFYRIGFGEEVLFLSEIISGDNDYSIAARIQNLSDGYAGTNNEIKKYRKLILQFVDELN